ncbi:uncharacterized protein LOC122644906 [Telopea speciosissima]|uniref:uncharacterized protein LOC122644906 n=1 Tax=Telopea speciosissima TaxID=54955 RepID=UPI001CC3E0D2|nr:uncharacterized protein LOC122644906 [Telopea speciosissima]
MVQSWIVHSTIPSIAHSILWFDSARDAWLDLHTRFSQKNAPHIFEIRRAISTHSEGLESISAYYTTLKGYRDELSSYRTLPTCTCGSVAALNVISDLDYLMDFLQGLHASYAAVRSQILLMDPLPSIPKAYSLLLQEERQRSIHSIAPATLDHAAMAAGSKVASVPTSALPKPHYHCTHYKMDGHSESQCFKKHSYLEGWTPHNTASKRPGSRGQPHTHGSPLAAAATSDSPTSSSAPTLSLAQI